MKKYLFSMVLLFLILQGILSCNQNGSQDKGANKPSNEGGHSQENSKYKVTFSVSSDKHGAIVAKVGDEKIASPYVAEKGVVIQFEAIAYDNYKIENWEGNVKKSDDLLTATLTVEKDENIKLSFAPREIKGFYLPYLRWFDSADELKEFEASRGNTLSQEDPTTGYLAFSSKSEKMPLIQYMVGNASQINLDAQTLQSAEFLKFMKDNGFEQKGAINNGMMIFECKNPNLKTVGAFSVIDKAAAGGYPAECVCFTMKPPVMEQLEEFPQIDWNASLDSVREYQKTHGFKESVLRKDNKNRTEIVFGKREIMRE